MKTYLEISINVETEECEEVENLLLSLGIEEIVIDSPKVAEEILTDKESHCWDYMPDDFLNVDSSTIKFYAEEVDNLSFLKELEKFKVDINRVSEDLWMNSYKEHFHAIILNEDIVICPSWEEPPEGFKHIINLDPGMAFGTGDHATTAMCTALLLESGCEGKKVWDVGTGSGILAIIAAKLGATSVLASDIDEFAVEVARENIAKNSLNEKIKVRQANLADNINFKADIVVANLIAEIVAELAVEIYEIMDEGAVFIASGILEEKLPALTEKLKHIGFVVREVLKKDGWSALRLEK